MSPSHSFDPTDHFTAGVIGEPGRRTFFLQAMSGGDLVSVKCEKQQVAALAEYLRSVLADLPAESPGVAGPLLDPVEVAFVAGTMSVAYDESADRLVLQVDELVPEPEDDPAGLDVQASSLRVTLTRAQVATFIAHADELVASGRPACELCGHPKGLDHHCPKTNGHGPPR